MFIKYILVYIVYIIVVIIMIIIFIDIKCVKIKYNYLKKNFIVCLLRVD